jgi:hypothetical protein
MSDISQKTLEEISKKLNALIALSVRQLLGEKEFGRAGRRKQGVGDIARFLSELGMDPKDIASILGSPVQSVRTLLTPKRRK